MLRQRVEMFWVQPTHRQRQTRNQAEAQEQGGPQAAASLDSTVFRCALIQFLQGDSQGCHSRGHGLGVSDL